MHDYVIITSLSLQREVQSHFGCSEMIGGELESQTVLQSAAGDSFWEKRVFGVSKPSLPLSFSSPKSLLTLLLSLSGPFS